jgi:PAS domain S-box-containing protein
MNASTRKRIALTLVVSLITVFTLAVIGTMVMALGQPLLGLAVVASGLATAGITYFFSYRHLYYSARFACIFNCNIIAMGLNALMPELHLYYFMFPIFLLPFLVFGKKEKLAALGAVVFTLGVALLVYFRVDIRLPEIHFAEGTSEVARLGAFLFAGLVSMVLVAQLSGTGDQVEDQLAEALAQTRSQQLELVLAKEEIETNLYKLQSSEEELRQNLEEMEATSEALKLAQQEAERARLAAEEAQRDSATAANDLGQIVAAIGNSLAILELAPDGTILSTNRIFRRLMGYTTNDLVGQHHRMLVPEAKRDSAEYKAFLGRLERGEPIFGEFERVKADGSPIIVSGQYNPVRDVEGKLVKMLKYAWDVTAEKQAARDRDAALGQAQAALSNLAQTNAQMADAQEALQKTLHELEAKREMDQRLATFSQQLRWDPAEPDTQWAERVLEKLGSLLPVLQCALFYHEPDPAGKHPHGLLRFKVGYGVVEPQQPVVPVGVQLLGQVARNGKPAIFSGQAVSHADCSAGLYNIQPKALMVIPLVANEKTQGVLELALHAHLDDSLAATIEKFTQLFATSIAHVKNQARIGQLLEESQQKNMALIQHEEEIRQTVDQLRDTQAQMQAYQKQLETVNADLEARVSERTAKLEGAIQELQSAQHQLVLSEKMAVLGQLVAGVAHEMNTPLGAIKAAASNVIDLLPRILKDTTEFLPTQDPQLARLATELLTHILTHPEVLSSREARQIRRTYAEELEAAGVPEAADVARSLVESGYHAELAPYLPLLTSPVAMPFLEMIGRLGQLILNVHNIDLATEKTSKVVFALKSYTHTKQGNQMEPANLPQLLDTVLSIYHNQLKYGVDVTTDFAEIPEVPCFADELSQVWTNLISNAVQAMEGRGNLHVEVRHGGDYAEVRITDSGPGIPAHIQAHIFEPFFTTKERGQGTGLGLDICKKIIDKHNGRISFETEPGRTTFIVQLPFAAPAEATASPAAQLAA